MLIPPIHAVGKFIAQPPYDTKISDKQIYTVTAVRTLEEISINNEDPLNNIYIDVGRTEADYLADLSNKIPIIVFTSTSNSFAYIPANMILQIPNIVGHKYQEKVLAINLGSIPLDIDLTPLKEDIIDLVRDTLGIATNIKVVDSSAIMVFTDVEHTGFILARANAMSNLGTYRSRYLKCNQTVTNLQNQISELECYIMKRESV